VTQRGRKSGKAAGNRGLIYGTKPGHRAKPLLHSIIGLLVAHALLLLLAGTDRRRMLAKSTAADLQHTTIKGAEDFCQRAWQRSPMMHLHAHAQEVQHMQQWAEHCSAVGANRLASSRLPNNGSVASRGMPLTRARPPWAQPGRPYTATGRPDRRFRLHQSCPPPEWPPVGWGRQSSRVA